MSERDSNDEIEALLKCQRFMAGMDGEFKRKWLDIEKPLGVSLLGFMTSRILVEYKELSFEEIMLTLNYVFVGWSDRESAFSIYDINDEEEKRSCIALLNNLVNIMEKLIIRTSKMFGMFEDSPSDNVKFSMSALLLRITGAICDHLYVAETNNLPIYFGEDYVTEIKPLLQTLTDDFLILKLWLYDFICDNFSSHDDFRVLVNNSKAKIRSSDLPHHPCNGPFDDELKRKYETMVERDLDSEMYLCNSCNCLLNELGDIAIWPDCEHVCYCSDCARLMFFGKGISKHEDTQDSSIQKSHLISKNKCPICSIPISTWSIGRYFSENVVYSIDPLPSDYAVLRRECKALPSIIRSSLDQRRTVSYVLPLILHATFLHVDMKYTIISSKFNLESFKVYKLVLSELCSGTIERGNSYLVQINIRCLKEAAQHFRKNSSWYSQPNTSEEFAGVLDQIETALGDLERKFLPGTAIGGA